ncbi:hypothetical protein [uncultured Microbacterium sp.]|uniref:Uncharacterized protein n=1 Tax=uncultured Microbacterium sp. TaxID=191216 RepID=A0A1Y5PBZ9_9MICO|nr:hypothetical protein [uncultured Microbacterium sp.]SBS73671.1 hypothetical protein MIPYR_40299 [uncultured Microbacterium sp.]
MERSPGGRRIEELEGEAATIIRRGRRIESIGRQMIQSADVLEDLVDGDDQRGKAIDKIREIVGDTYVELRRAGRMYEPTGPVLIDYGQAVGEVQPLIRIAVSACEQAWVDYAAAPSHPTALLDMVPDLAESRREDNERKDELYDDWVLEARAFDRHYDTWEDAFDAAVTGIGEVLEGAIEDSFWDDLDGVVAVVLEVLGWVSLVIAIAGIIIGGPIFALIGAVLGVVTLLLTAYQVLRQDAGADKLIIAIIGVIPFGKVGKLFQGRAGMLAFGGEMVTAFRPSAWSAAGGQLRNMSILSRFAGGGVTGAQAAFRGLWSMNNPAGAGDIMCRFMFGRNSQGLTDLAETVGGSVNGWCTSSTISAAWEGGYMMVSGAWGVGDKIATWTGNKDLKPSSVLPWVGALL